MYEKTKFVIEILKIVIILFGFGIKNRMIIKYWLEKWVWKYLIFVFIEQYGRMLKNSTRNDVKLSLYQQNNILDTAKYDIKIG